MTINYYGLSCLKIESAGTVIATNPYSKVGGLQSPRFEANVVLGSTEEFADSSIAGDPFVITGPGEYDLRGVLIRGIAVNTKETIYLIEWDGISTLFLGELKNASMEDVEKAVRSIKEGVDILIVPAGSPLGGKDGAALVKLIEPRITVPTTYALKGVKEKHESLDAFLKAVNDKPKEEEKLSVKKNTLPSDTTELVILSAPVPRA